MNSQAVMSLRLYMHPLASFCWKPLIALYENETPFDPQIVDLGNDASRAAFLKIWPMGKFPLLRDETRDQTIPESTIIIEYLAQHYPGKTMLLPADPDLAREARLRDRFFDMYVQEPMQKIVGDRLRPPSSKDPFGVAHARSTLHTAYGIAEQEMATKTWACGESFTLADCAAAPALFYANIVQPFGNSQVKLQAYLERLLQRPSFARVIREARPYFAMFPTEPGDHAPS
ncbi:MAG TPA: glutathione S-transferase family protein [Steroidobacter sp.]|jgi:glutathione S-transferase|nr:glutathione S-transferase family protein [Steroidobacter sp.]